MISVIIPTYNKGPFIEAALESVAGQTLSDFEILIVDDGSTDGTERLVSAAGFSNLRYLRTAHAGIAAARNRGLSESRRPYVAFLDSDDLWRPDHLEKALAALEGPSALVAAGDYDEIDALGRGLGVSRAAEGRGVHPGFARATGLPFLPLLQGAVFRRELVKRAGGFDEGFRSAFEDIDFFARIHGRFGPDAFRIRAQSSCAYRRHRGQATWGMEGFLLDVPSRMAKWKLLAPRERDCLLDLARLKAKHAQWLKPILAAA